jgi:hypothetical protein
VTGLDWNVSEVGAHLVASAQGYLDFARGADSSLFTKQPAEINAERLVQYTVRDTAVLAEELPKACSTFLSAVAADDSKMTMVGIHADRATAAGGLLAELLVHGRDIARATRSRWRIDRGDALITFYAGLNFLPVFVNSEGVKKLRATYEVRPRGGEPVTMAVRDGTLEIRRGRADRPDCIISGDPVTMMLVGYRRQSHWIGALSGKAIAHGRKPWLAMRFNKLVSLP